LAATRKEVKYAGIVGRHMFEPIAVVQCVSYSASGWSWQEEFLNFW